MTFTVCLIYFTALPFLVSGELLSDKVHQMPKDKLVKIQEPVTLTCSHTIPNYDMILWYEQVIGDVALNLIGYVSFTRASTESQYTNRFIIKGDGEKSSTLEFKLNASESSVMYYCAASKGMGSGAHFGNGTKLTVLERKEIDPPEVNILKPSENEMRCKEKVTLVCVAKNFYPDHVNMTWIVGSKEIKDDVATDPYATRNGKTFTISSRLKVPKQMYNKVNRFDCKVTFYNGTAYDDFFNANEVYGDTEIGYTREDYVNSSKTIRLAYGVFIAKSGLYGLVIFVFVWRKGSSGK